jgi:uncharacterized OB-fold protein
MSMPRNRREMPQRYRLEAAACKGCGKIFFPPRQICSECKGREFECSVLPGKGKVVTYTVIRIAPSDFVDQAPYAIGIIEFENTGVKTLMQIVDVPIENLKIGMPVKTEFRKIYSDGNSGIINYGYKAVPA